MTMGWNNPMIKNAEAPSMIPDQSISCKIPLLIGTNIDKNRPKNAGFYLYLWWFVPVSQIG